MSMIELDRAAVQRSFERAASSYERFAVLQHEVESRLLERLEFTREDPRVILDVGCGTGTATPALSRRFPAASTISLDWSQAMLHKARQHHSTNQERVLCADMHEIPLAMRSVDLVFSNLAVQWSSHLEALLVEFRRVLKPGGLLMFSSFGPDTLHELRAAWAKVDDRPHVNRFMDMHDVGDALVRSGFSEPVMDVDMLTLEYPDVMGLMRELKAIGAHNAAAGRARGLTGKHSLRRMLEAYEPFRRDDIYPASYEVIYGLAYGPLEGQPVRGPEGEYAAFSVESLMKGRGGSK
ncbi:MAG: malonyl-ACP O-methyltransferase BioC [Xanthomonadales bacterium]|nr:malonyl-ACP O-methyltransferase BioC [Xanthomonadales bacterium]NNL96056.1 malonyl-ACP O-methyltransferase BioC [Xanthomonadales bacterium]